jgi:hypothetical protein
MFSEQGITLLYLMRPKLDSDSTTSRNTKAEQYESSDKEDSEIEAHHIARET